LEAVGFGEVMQPIDPLGVAVQKQQHGARAVLLPLEQEQVIGAKVEHAGVCLGLAKRQKRAPQESGSRPHPQRR
jgi:hypothetical protein